MSASKPCPGCGRDMPSWLSFCVECGASLGRGAGTSGGEARGEAQRVQSGVTRAPTVEVVPGSRDAASGIAEDEEWEVRSTEPTLSRARRDPFSTPFELEGSGREDTLLSGGGGLWRALGVLLLMAAAAAGGYFGRIWQESRTQAENLVTAPIGCPDVCAEGTGAAAGQHVEGSGAALAAVPGVHGADGRSEGTASAAAAAREAVPESEPGSDIEPAPPPTAPAVDGPVASAAPPVATPPEPAAPEPAPPQPAPTVAAVEPPSPAANLPTGLLVDLSRQAVRFAQTQATSRLAEQGGLGPPPAAPPEPLPELPFELVAGSVQAGCGAAEMRAGRPDQAATCLARARQALGSVSGAAVRELEQAVARVQDLASAVPASLEAGRCNEAGPQLDELGALSPPLAESFREPLRECIRERERERGLPPRTLE